MDNVLQQKIINLLSMAQRANQLISGESGVEKCVRSGRAKLLIVATDVSDGTRKKYCDMANFHKLETRCILDKKCLGGCIGKNERAAVVLENEGFIKALLKLLDNGDQN